MREHQKELPLSAIPVTRWVRGTVSKMQRAGSTDVRDWTRFWFATYRELGGNSEASGRKSCPRAAAFGLWFLGRLRCGHRPLDRRSVKEIDRAVGKNAAYAVIAVELLGGGAASSLETLWPSVQQRYVRETGQDPATTEQGEVRLAATLFLENEAVPVKPTTV